MRRARPATQPTRKSAHSQLEKIAPDIAEILQRIQRKDREAKAPTARSSRPTPSAPAPYTPRREPSQDLLDYWALEDRLSAHPTLMITSQRLYLRIARYLYRGLDHCTDSYPTLARKATISRTTLYFHLAALEAKGAIKREQDNSPFSGLQIGSIITLNPKWRIPRRNGRT